MQVISYDICGIRHRAIKVRGVEKGTIITCNRKSSPYHMHPCHKIYDVSDINPTNGGARIITAFEIMWVEIPRYDIIATNFASISKTGVPLCCSASVEICCLHSAAIGLPQNVKVVFLSFLCLPEREEPKVALVTGSFLLQKLVLYHTVQKGTF